MKTQFIESVILVKASKDNIETEFSVAEPENTEEVIKANTKTVKKIKSLTGVAGATNVSKETKL